MVASSIVWTVSVSFSMATTDDVRITRLAEAGREAEPLIHAIRTYEADHHEPPRNLEALVPTYMPAVRPPVFLPTRNLATVQSL